MQDYSRFWILIKERGITQYKLSKDYGISRGTLDRMRKKLPLSFRTIQDLCNALQCSSHEIVEITPDPPKNK